MRLAHANCIEKTENLESTLESVQIKNNRCVCLRPYSNSGTVSLQASLIVVIMSVRGRYYKGCLPLRPKCVCMSLESKIRRHSGNVSVVLSSTSTHLVLASTPLTLAVSIGSVRDAQCAQRAHPSSLFLPGVAQRWTLFSQYMEFVRNETNLSRPTSASMHPSLTARLDSCEQRCGAQAFCGSPCWRPPACPSYKLR